MWNFRWLRRFIRRRTKPVPKLKAYTIREKLSIAYMLIAWNAFGMVCYMIYTGRKDWAKYYGYKTEEDEKMSPGIQWAKTFNIENAKIVRFSGFQKAGEVDIKDGEVHTPDSEASS